MNPALTSRLTKARGNPSVKNPVCGFDICGDALRKGCKYLERCKAEMQVLLMKMLESSHSLAILEKCL